MLSRFFLWLPFFLALCLVGCPGRLPPESSLPDSSLRPEPTVLPENPPERCLPNNDGIIELSEVTFLVGASVSFLRNRPGMTVQIDQKGRIDGEGQLVWDFRSADAPEKTSAQTVDPAGKWFLPSFPSPSLLIPTTFPGFQGTLYQVLRVAGSDLLLDGIASEREKPETEQILLPYETPVPLLRFPLRDGKEWIVSAKAKGTVGGLPVSSTDNYTFRVQGRGKLRLPDIDFENTLRLLIQVQQRLLGGSARTFYQVLFLHECYGEIARIESKDGESDPDFQSASFLRFLSF